MFALAERPETRLQGLARRRRELDALEAEWLAELAEYDRSGEWYDDGHLGAAAALREECRMTSATARAHLRLARKLTGLTLLAEALAAGEISREHATVITRACTPAREAAFVELERAFVDAAKTMDPEGLRGVVAYACGALDGDGGAAGDEDTYRQRRLSVSPTIGGIGMLDGQLDSIGTEIVITALDARMDHDRLPNESRTPVQRRADALVAICRWALEHGEAGGSRKTRPQASAVFDIETLSGSAPELVHELRAEAAYAGHLSVASLELLTCDCSLSRVITAGRSEILDVGRATRTIPPAIWRALVVRDQHCQAPGCDRPPGWCEAHHIVHWSRGGSTSLDNLVLLCWHHHQQQHHADGRRRRLELAQR